MTTQKNLTNLSEGVYINGRLIQDVQEHQEPPLYYDCRNASPLAPAPTTRSAVTLTDGTVLYSEHDAGTLREAARNANGQRRNGFIAVSEYAQVLAEAVIAVFPYSAVLQDAIECSGYTVQYSDKKAQSIVILSDELCILSEYSPDDIAQVLQGQA